jgi:hypothetical protein
MGKKLPRIQKVILGASTLTLLSLPLPTLAQTATTQEQSTATQDRQQDRQDVQTDDITRRDLARFDQFLDSHREDAQQLRRTPSLVDDPQYLQSHPALSSYLQEHPSVKQEISQRPDTFMRLEDRYDHDSNLRDRDAGGRDGDANRGNASNDRDRDANGQDRDADRRNADNDRDRDQNHGAERRDVASFDRFLNDHREIAEQVRKNPSLVDNPQFVQSHPALQTYLQQNPGVRDMLRQDPNAFMQMGSANDRDTNVGDRYGNGQDRDANGQNGRDRDANRRDASNDRDAGGPDRDDHRREVNNFDRFLDSHREIAEQVRKDPSLLDNRNFVQGHPVLQAYLEQNPGVRDQLRQDPNAFMRQEDMMARDDHQRDIDPSHNRMADFGGWLGSHSDVQRDLSRNPEVVKDHDYVQNHGELNSYLNAHPDVRAELMANPQSFVQGAQQYNNASASGSAGMNGRGSGTTGSSTTTTGTSTTRPATTPTKPQ